MTWTSFRRVVILTAVLATAACSSAPEGVVTRRDDLDAAGSTSTAVEPLPSTVASQPTSIDTEVPVPTPKVRPIDEPTAGRMAASWRPGCPVPLSSLRLVTIQHWSFDGDVRTGELVVAAEHAEAIAGVFDGLLAARFPIAQVRLVDEFGGDDDRSMSANNTSAFNCRQATGSTRWSEHAYGLAVDINPVQNPYVTASGRVLPPAGRTHAQRDRTTLGLIVDGDPVVGAFAAIGWSWGGSWSAGKDYQHFSATGR